MHQSSHKVVIMSPQGRTQTHFSLLEQSNHFPSLTERLLRSYDCLKCVLMCFLLVVSVSEQRHYLNTL